MANPGLTFPMEHLKDILLSGVNLGSISAADFDKAVRVYSHTVPRQLQDGSIDTRVPRWRRSADAKRFNDIPSRLRPSGAIAPARGITKAELGTLSYWAYKRCVSSDRCACKTTHERMRSDKYGVDVDVDGVTLRAFQEYREHRDLQTVVKTLMEGLQMPHRYEMATLILSVAYPDELPFLSPELMWCYDEQNGPGNEEVDAAARYQSVLNLVQQTKDRLGRNVTAHDIEKAAYVLRLMDGLRPLYTDPANISPLPDARLENPSDSRNKIERATLLTAPNPAEIVAVKWISASPSTGQSVLNDLNEIKISRGMSRTMQQWRDHFVEFYNWSYNQGHVLIVMELMHLDLEKYLQLPDGKPRTWKDVTKSGVKRPLSQILEGLQALHDHQTAHRDLKPQNIFVNGPNGENLKIADFGTSKRARHLFTTLVTRLGTPGYIAPEVMKAPDPLDASYNLKADMWSLGCILYRMKYGKPLFPSNQDVGWMRVTIENVKKLPHRPWDKEDQLLWDLVRFKADGRPDAATALRRCEGWSN